MRSLRAVGFAGAVLLALVAWSGRGARKEHVRLAVSAQSGAPVRVRVVTRGMLLLTGRLSQGRQPWQVITTFSTPVELALAGVGEADIVGVDSTNKLIVDVVQVREQAPPTRRLTGAGFRVSRSSYTEVFAVAPLGKAGVLARE